MEQVRGLAIRLAVDEPVGDDLPMAAADALTRGVDYPSLRELAGLSKGSGSGHEDSGAVVPLRPSSLSSFRYGRCASDDPTP
ncbi:hypothetical protein E1211_25960 [Micromonospora sp. 15K316]|uniref:hypothetical protein n=1 Tax=Micromonospora sp. 15K316 TaxID=2530376 RepID=UPI00104DBDB0|nr:hypothetical protein [Micromonospora sp. 15K316]TDC29475.1 hypothetical protein E1211_25960 [Micromonospora sp. 15K316]